MKLTSSSTFALPALALALYLGLTACGKAETPAEQSGTTVEQGDDWVATPEQEGAVNVDLPDAPVAITTPDSSTMPEAEITPPAE
jgi:hypothetical protein